jgi:hypothetical protein
MAEVVHDLKLAATADWERSTAPRFSKRAGQSVPSPCSVGPLASPSCLLVAHLCGRPDATRPVIPSVVLMLLDRVGRAGGGPLGTVGVHDDRGLLGRGAEKEGT